MSDKRNAVQLSNGVETLIERLREEGVAKGRQEAELIVRDAEHRAEWLVSQAQEEAERILAEARSKNERLERSTDEALRVAARDAVLNLKTHLAGQFAAQVRRLVSRQLSNEVLLEKLILELVGRVREDLQLDEAERVEVVLPHDVVGIDELRRRPEQLKEGTLSHFVLTVAEEMLREGVSFTVADDERSGLRLRLSEGELEIDLSDQAVAALLMAHLQPRFRALLEGIVR
jgi:V/A-type H+/Na+-transporting ATPase subunit E